MKRLILTTLALLFSAHALAEGCGKNATQYDLNICASQDFTAADKKLNETYATVMKRLPDEHKGLLKTAQQKWIALRDADCEFIASGTEGGTVQPMIRLDCRTGKTKERTDWLESMLNCEEGDMGCPVPRAP
ncbi:lysozyme inhibitor LprI family protein [Enterobacteriaceae bacterium C23F]